MAEASAVKKRVSKRRTRPGGVIARAIRNSPDGSGSRPASVNGFHGPSSAGAAPLLLRPRQSPVSSQASRIAATASERARDGVIFGLPFRRFASSAFGIGAATGTRLSVLSTRPPGKTNLPGMNTTLSWRLPTRTFGVAHGAIDQDQRGGVDRAAIGVMVGFFLFLDRLAFTVSLISLPPARFVSCW